MGKYPPQSTSTVRLIDHLLNVSDRYVKELQRYLFRYIELKRITYEMIKELPADRQHYYTELIAGIDNRVRSAYYGTQGNDHGTTKPVQM